MANYDEPGTLMQRTRALMEGRDLLAIYKDTGLNFYWLRKFAAAEHKNPSVNRVQHLYEYLTGSKLLQE